MKNISGDLDACSITGRHCDSDSWVDCSHCGAKKLRDDNALMRQRLTTAEGVITNMEKSMEAVARERDEARDSLTDLLKLMLPRPAGEPVIVADTLNMPLTGSPLVMRVVECMISVLREGPGNFRAVSFRSAKDGQEYSLTIQREGGKTPAQRIAELEETAKSLLTDLAASNEEMKRLRGVIADLRRKIGEWAAEVEKGAYWPALIEEMMEEVGKC